MSIFSRSTNGSSAERGLFAFIFFLFFCAAGSAAAGYSPDSGLVREGGGTWGSILEMSAELRGPDIVFNVRRQDRMPMYPESRISIRTGSWRGGDAASGTVSSGSRSVTLTVRDEGGKPQSYYACISNSYGHAWVGPLKLGGYDGANDYDGPGDVGMEAYPPEHSSSSDSVGRPRIDSWPSSAWVDERVSIAVTAGWCRNGGMVRLRCMAEGSDKPYKSDWIRTGDTVEVPFRFKFPGKKRISCVTLDSCCASPEVSRSILIKEVNRVPRAPKISSKPAEIKLKVPVHISVLPGSDPDDDQVKVECKAEDARTFSSSGWFNSPQWTDAVFTFEQPGSKRISCITIDRRGGVSRTTERLIEVTAPQSAVLPSTGETRINISVVTKPDGTADSRVSVESSRSEGCAPFCDGDITYDKPYLPAPYYDGPEQNDLYPVYEP
uniref:hypothetical protein n=1 Tax=Candidatus Electronema sp. TaxID=2698783 RepID=UPI004056A172